MNLIQYYKMINFYFQVIYPSVQSVSKLWDPENPRKFKNE